MTLQQENGTTVASNRLVATFHSLPLTFDPVILFFVPG